MTATPVKVDNDEGTTITVGHSVIVHITTFNTAKKPHCVYDWVSLVVLKVLMWTMTPWPTVMVVTQCDGELSLMALYTSCALHLAMSSSMHMLSHDALSQLVLFELSVDCLLSWTPLRSISLTIQNNSHIYSKLIS